MQPLAPELVKRDLLVEVPNLRFKEVFNLRPRIKLFHIHVGFHYLLNISRFCKEIIYKFKFHRNDFSAKTKNVQKIMIAHIQFAQKCVTGEHETINETTTSRSSEFLKCHFQSDQVIRHRVNISNFINLLGSGHPRGVENVVPFLLRKTSIPIFV